MIQLIPLHNDLNFLGEIISAGIECVNNDNVDSIRKCQPELNGNPLFYL